MSEKKTKTRRPLEVIQTAMVTLTAEAAEKIKNALQRYSGSGVRIRATQNEKGRVSFSLDVEDQAQSNDLVLEEKGIKLFVDPLSAHHVQGIEIRYVKREKGSGFAIVSAGTG